MQNNFGQILQRFYYVPLAYFLVGLGLCLYVAALDPYWAAGLAVFWLAIFLLALKLEWGIYALAFFLPVIHWDFYFLDLVIPFIDILGLLMIAAFAWRYLLMLLLAPGPAERLRLPFFLPYFLFAGIALISGWLAPDKWASLWYAVRWILFFYTAYVFVPVNVVKGRSVLRCVLIAFVMSGFITALMGAFSFLGQDWRQAYIRVLPVSIFGVWPLGQNQNLVAEVLLPAFFYALIFRQSAGGRWAKILNIGLVFMAAIIVLTFSRAAWLSLFICGLLYLIYHYRQELRRIILPAYLIATIMAPVFAYMYLMQTDYSVGVGSTRSRLLSTQIAIEAWQDKPWLGHGPGEYINIIDNNIRFIAKFGNPLESHGVLQKVLAETGGLGLLAFLIMLAAIAGQIIYYIRRYPDQRAWLVPIALAALSIFIFQLTNTSFYKGKLWLPIALAFLSGPVLTQNAKRVTRNAS